MWKVYEENLEGWLQTDMRELSFKYVMCAVISPAAGWTPKDEKEFVGESVEGNGDYVIVIIIIDCLAMLCVDTSLDHIGQ
jgi:hypothetical protein